MLETCVFCLIVSNIVYVLGFTKPVWLCLYVVAW